MFSQKDDYIRHVSELKLDIVDRVPVKTSYRSIAQALYDEVKNYLHNFIAKEFVRKS